MASAPPAVVVAQLVHADAGTAGGLAIRYPVEVAARYSNPMSFRVSEKLIERKVRIGDTVKNGAPSIECTNAFAPNPLREGT